MSVEPVYEKDPHDPQVILRCLPDRERAEFLRQYHQAVDGARDPAGYRELQRILHVWSLIVSATGRPGYYEELEAAKIGTASTVPAAEVIEGWEERLAAARTQGR
jgi:hypothetical protein